MSNPTNSNNQTNPNDSTNPNDLTNQTNQTNSNDQTDMSCEEIAKMYNSKIFKNLIQLQYHPVTININFDNINFDPSDQIEDEK